MSIPIFRRIGGRRAHSYGFKYCTYASDAQSFFQTTRLMHDNSAPPLQCFVCNLYLICSKLNCFVLSCPCYLSPVHLPYFCKWDIILPYVQEKAPSAFILFFFWYFTDNPSEILLNLKLYVRFNIFSPFFKI